MSNKPISNHDTPDPWLIPSPLQPNLFYLTFTLGNRIEIWSSPSIEDFHDTNPHIKRSTIWQPPPNTPWSADIWAPELHFLYGNWFVYAASAHPDKGNASHRTIVLRCTSANRDPLEHASWEFLGPLRGVPDDQWAIDATVFSPDPGLGQSQGGYPDEQRRWYICYSGWPLGDHSDTQQDLFIARLRSPTEADPQSLTTISRAELPWERPDDGRRGVNEGPTWVSMPPSHGCPQGWRGIVYSAHGSWTSEYKLAVVQFVGGPNDDCCNPQLWRKRQTPLLVSDKAKGGPFGPGHASFVPSPHGDGSVLCVYHGTENEGEGWNNRKGRVLMMSGGCFVEQGSPMCCAYSMCGPVRDTHSVFPGGQGHAQQPQRQGVYPGQAQQSYAGNSGGAPQQNSFNKYADQIEKRIPPQYQGYFNKAKKFFK